MNGTTLLQQLGELLNSEITVAVGEELITGILDTVTTEYIILLESTNNYENESRSRIILISQISFIRVAVAA